MSILVPHALDARRSNELADAIEACIDPVIVLEGRGDVFCRGMDFTATASESTDDGVAAFARCIRAIRTAGKPVIAAVDGIALGGGVGIAAAADLLLATPRATFGLPEVLFGLVPGVVMPILLERLRPQQARLFALSARSRSAGEAERLGLVDAVVSDLAAAIRRSTRELSRARPAAVAALKRLTLDAAAVERGAAHTSRLLRSPAVLAAVQTFTETEELPWLAE
jgi:enoyl-CoA hydratase/carnithine racemase